MNPSWCLNFASSCDAHVDVPALREYLNSFFRAAMLMPDEMMEEMKITQEETKKIKLPERYSPKDHSLHDRVRRSSMELDTRLDKNKPGIFPEALEINTAGEMLNPAFKASIPVTCSYNFFILAKILRATSKNVVSICMKK
jgi:hypothetical protein